VEHGPALSDIAQTVSKAEKKVAGKKPAVHYAYRDATGRLLYEVVRMAPKGFFQRRPDKNSPDGWTNSMAGVKMVPYRLPDLVSAPHKEPVYIPEGEKDADNMAALGLVATTNAGGAGKWKDEYNEHLKGRHIIILEDNDPAGRDHVQKVAKSLEHVAASIKIVALPDLPEKGDVSDWIQAGGNRKKLEQIVSETPYTKAPIAPKTFRLMDLQKEVFAPIKWAIPDILPEGLTLLCGKPKLGKSWMLLSMMCAISAGGVALGSVPVEHGEVLYLSLEDNKRRLQTRANTVLSNLQATPDFHYAIEWPRLNEGGLDLLEQWIIEHPRVRLIGIDTWAKFKPRLTGGAKPLYDVDTEAITPLHTLASKYNIAIVLVHHQRKQESEDPLDTISGSIGIQASVDGFLILYRKRGEDDARLLITGRDIEDQQELMLQFENNTCTWKIKGDASEVASTPERQAILDVLKPCPKGLTLKQIAERLQKNVNTTRNLIASLRNEGKIKLEGNIYIYSNPSKDSKSSNPSKSSKDPVEKPKEVTTGYYEVTTGYYAENKAIVTPMKPPIEQSKETSETAGYYGYYANYENATTNETIRESSATNKYEYEEEI
jgi:hypothetical protein